MNKIKSFNVKKVEIKHFLTKLIFKKKENIVKFENKNFMNLESIDSMSVLKIILKIEDKYKIKLEDKFIFSNKFKTIRGITDIIAKKLNY